MRTQPEQSQNMDNNRHVNRSMLVATLLLGLTLVFGSVFTLSTLHRAYVGKIVAEYTVVTRALQRELEDAVKFGDGLEAMDTLEQTLSAVRAQLLRRVFVPKTDTDEEATQVSQDVVLALIAPNGNVINSTDAGQAGASVRQAVLREIERLAKRENPTSDVVHLQRTSGLEMLLPVRDVRGQLAATLVVEVSARLSSARADQFRTEISKIVIITMLCGISIVAVFLRRLWPYLIDDESRFRWRLTATMFALLILFQTLSTTISVLAFKYDYFFMSRSLAEQSLSTMVAEMKPALGTGIQLEQLGDLDRHIAGLMDSNPGLVEAGIWNATGEPLAVQNRAFEPGAAISFARHAAKLFHPAYTSLDYRLGHTIVVNGKEMGIVSARFADWTLYQSLFDIILQGLTVLIVASLFAGELIILVTQYLQIQLTRSKEKRSSAMTFHVMRPILFFFLFGIDISMSFVPLHMETLYEPLFGLSREFVIGLPISMEFMCVGIAILAAGVWLDRRGWHEPLLAGIALAAFGVLYSFISGDALHFILSRAIVGLGFGLVLIACQGFVITNTGDDNRTHGLAHLFAGLYAGSICGGAVGALLADQIGYEAVFLGGFIVLAGVFAFVISFMRSTFKRPERQVEQPVTTSDSQGNAYADFLLDRKVLCITFLSSLPAAIAVIGFLNYFSPIYLSRMGASQTTIGQVMLIYGISLVLVGPAISRRIDAAGDKRYAIFIGSVLGGLAFLAFQFFDGLTAAVIAMLLLGLSSSFILASQTSYLLALPVTARLGKGVGVGIFRATSRLGQVAGPMIFGALIASAGMQQGVAFLGIAYLIVAVLFLLVSIPRWPKRRMSREDRAVTPSPAEASTASRTQTT